MQGHALTQDGAARDGTTTTTATNQPGTHFLANLIEGLTSDLTVLETQVAEGRTALQAASVQQRQVKADLTILKQAAEAFAGLMDKARKAEEEAAQALADVEGHINSLSAAEQATLKGGVVAIDADIATKEDALSSGEQELATLRQKAVEAERTLESRSIGFKAAIDALSGVSESLRHLVTPLDRLTSELETAAESGQTRKLYVLSLDITSQRAKISDLLAEDALKAHVEAYKKTRDDLAEAREKHAAATAAVTDQERTVAARRTTVERMRATRKEAIKQLLATQSPAAPTTAKTQ